MAKKPKQPRIYEDWELPTRLDQLLSLKSEAQVIDQLVHHVSNGGSAIEMAKIWEVSFSSLMEWVHGNPIYERRYAQAIKDRNEWTIESTLQELRRVAGSDLRGAFIAGDLKDPTQWTDKEAAAVQSIKIHEDNQGNVTREVKLWDKLKAIELVGKNLKLFSDQVTLKADETLADLIMESMKQDNDGK